MNVKYRIVMAMVTAQMVNVFVHLVSKGNFVLKWTAQIQTVVATGYALKELVFAKKVGKASTVTKWIKMPYNVYPIVRDTGHLIWKHRHVSVNPCGLVKIVPKNCVTWTVAHMVIV